MNPLTFTANKTIGDISCQQAINILNDDVAEGNESFVARLRTRQPHRISIAGARDTMEIVIIDDDSK